MSGFAERLKGRRFWIRFFHWEYWSFHALYLPIYPIWLLLCLRARSLFFFAASNPKIKNGGFLGESKREVYGLVPSRFQPKTLFFNPGTDQQKVLEQLREQKFQFPLIGKPDIGGRGRGVKKLCNETEVLCYAAQSGLDFHIQEFIPFENELGIFYYRLPGQQYGKISGIANKEFLTVTGNGKHPVRELLKGNPRGVLQLPVLEENHPELMSSVLREEEVCTVVPYGNHARGAKFLDGKEKITPALTRMVDALCRQIPDFYFGRLDIRFRNQELLEAGKDFSVVEVNGAGSEPTHIYDPRHSLFFAWKEIIRHWIILFKISRANHRRGYPYLSFQEGYRMFKEDKRYSKQLDKMKMS